MHAQNPLPSDPSALAATREALLKSSHLPGYVYTDPEIFAREVENIFMKEWLCVGRVEEFEKTGDYLAARIVGESILVCRNRAGHLNAFRNMCRHRGVEVAPLGQGNASRFSCPYHAWTYNLEGQLIGAGRTEGVQSFDFKSCSLPKIKVDEWGGWVFINFDPNSVSLSERLDSNEIRDFATFIQPERTRLVHKLVLNVNCNWKFMPENVVDMYHVGIIHASSFGGKNFKLDDIHYNLVNESYNIYYRSDTMTPGGKTLTGTMPWLKGKVDEQFACTTWIPPNMTLFARHDLIQPLVVMPIDVDHTQITVYTQLPIDVMNDPELPAKTKILGDFIELVLGEDARLLESLHNASKSKGYMPGPLVNLERGIHQLLNYWLDKIYGPDTSARDARVAQARDLNREAEQKSGGHWNPTRPANRYQTTQGEETSA